MTLETTNNANHTDGLSMRAVRNENSVDFAIHNRSKAVASGIMKCAEKQSALSRPTLE